MIGLGMTNETKDGQVMLSKTEKAVSKQWAGMSEQKHLDIYDGAIANFERVITQLKLTRKELQEKVDQK